MFEVTVKKPDGKEFVWPRDYLPRKNKKDPNKYFPPLAACEPGKTTSFDFIGDQVEPKKKKGRAKKVIPTVGLQFTQPQHDIVGMLITDLPYLQLDIRNPEGLKMFFQLLAMMRLMDWRGFLNKDRFTNIVYSLKESIALVNVEPWIKRIEELAAKIETLEKEKRDLQVQALRSKTTDLAIQEGG